MGVCFILIENLVANLMDMFKFSESSAANLALTD